MTTKYNVGEKVWVASKGGAAYEEIEKIVSCKMWSLQYHIDGERFFESQVHPTKNDLIAYLLKEND